jgi:hypothetical protein
LPSRNTCRRLARAQRRAQSCARARSPNAIGLRSFINRRACCPLHHPSLVKVYRFRRTATAYMVMPSQGVTPATPGAACRTPDGPDPQRPDADPVGARAAPSRRRLPPRHRPDNILTAARRPAVLLDFGAARRVIGDRTQSLTGS